MVAKSILEIDVNDSQFKAFMALHERYQEALKQSPQEWRKVASAIDDTASAIGETGDEAKQVAASGESAGKSWARFATALEAIQKGIESIDSKTAALSDSTDKAAKSQTKFAEATHQASTHLHSASEASRSMFNHIFQATKSLLKWEAILTAFSGIIGLGGLWGIDRLALTAGSTLYSAQGLGAAPQGMQAFKINFARYFNPEQVLQNVGASELDLSRQWAFRALGVSPTGKTAADAAQLLLHTKEMIGNRAPTVQYAHAMGMTNFFTMDDLRRIAATPLSQLQASESHYLKDQAALAVPDSVRRAWQDLTIQLNKAGVEITNVLEKDLVALAPGLEKLSDGFANAVSALLGSKGFKDGIDAVAHGLNYFAKWVDSPKFESDVVNFATEVTVIVKELARFTTAVAQTSDWFLRNYSKGKPLNKQQLHQVPGLKADPFVTAPEKHAAFITGPNGQPMLIEADYETPSRYQSALEAAYRLPHGLLGSVEQAESGGNPWAVSPAGAEGAFQFMPATARQYGINPFDPVASARAAAQMFSALLTHYSGNIKQALAAYNWGEGNVDQDIARNGAGWMRHLPKETQTYIERVTGAMSRVEIEVNNNTGGSAIISTNQVAL